MPSIKYSKHNRVRFKSLEKKEAGIKMFTEFFSSIRKEEVGKKMKGDIILDSTSDFQESICTDFLGDKRGYGQVLLYTEQSPSQLGRKSKALI